MVLTFRVGVVDYAYSTVERVTSLALLGFLLFLRIFVCMCVNGRRLTAVRVDVADGRMAKHMLDRNNIHLNSFVTYYSSSNNVFVVFVVLRRG